MPTYNITEDLPFDLSVPSTSITFTLSNTAYDVVIDDLPFIVKVDNQNPYRRETAPYKKEQFDNSPEPGEQSLTGWALRSQTSWHNGAGINFYDAGTDYEHVSHRFTDSRGVDIWNTGEASLLPDVFHAYTGAAGINAATGNNAGTDVLVSGDANGVLKRITLDGNSAATTADYVHTATSYPEGHNGSNFGFTSVTTSGGKYYATCTGAIHRGTIGTLNSDVVFARHSATTNAFVKYAKGFIFFGENHVLNLIDDSQGNTNAHSGALPAGKQYDSRTHLDSTFVWNDIAGGQTHIYASGNAGNSGEIWKIPFDGTPTSTNNGTLLPDLSSSTVNVTLPDSELVKAIHFYLGYLVVGTNRGVRICPISTDGDLILGPLLVETSYPVNGFTERGTYIYAATKADAGAYTNAILIRIDLTQSFSDGTFAYAYDLEYQTNLQPSSSEATEVYNLNNRLVMVVQEDGTGELQVEHSSLKRSSGWIQTGKIRYGTVEPKFFRYINVQCTTGSGDNIVVSTLDQNELETPIATLSEGLSNQDVLIVTPDAKQEHMAFKFTLNNLTDDQDLPVIKAYQIKSIIAPRRQRLYQYPLSCYDKEMDRYNSMFGYDGRAMEYIQRIEAIEETGKFVNVTDYRTGEAFEGVIEEVRFTNESSPDKNNSGFGGLLLVTVRKL